MISFFRCYNLQTPPKHFFFPLKFSDSSHSRPQCQSDNFAYNFRQSLTAARTTGFWKPQVTWKAATPWVTKSILTKQRSSVVCQAYTRHGKQTSDLLTQPLAAWDQSLFWWERQMKQTASKRTMRYTYADDCLVCILPSTNTSQFWLLGYEFPATLLVFTPDVMYVVTTAKKGIVQHQR